MKDFRGRIGLPVERVEVRRIDFLYDTAELTIYYDEPQIAASTNSVELLSQEPI